MRDLHFADDGFVIINAKRSSIIGKWFRIQILVKLPASQISAINQKNYNCPGF